MNECPECGATVAAGHGRCPTCGHDLRDETRRCDRCGETIAADAPSCPACGALYGDADCQRHPDRTARGLCALCATPLCAECDAGDRRYHRCADHADVPIIEGWAEVLAVPDEVDAHLIEENLRAEGIDSRTLSKKDHTAFPVEFGDLARVRILVPTYAYVEAGRLLEAHKDAGGDVSFGCPNCGEPADEEDAVCSKCGEALV